LKILSQGSLLALSGERKVVALVRDLPGIRVDIGRVLPDQLQHLISQSDGDFPIRRSAAVSVLTIWSSASRAKFRSGTWLTAKQHYETHRSRNYLKGEGAKSAVSSCWSVQGYDPKVEAARRQAAARAAALGDSRRTASDAADPDAADIDVNPAAEYDGDDIFNANPSGLVERRFVLVADLGILVKKSTDGTQDVFVQSIQSGQPVAAATVEIIAKNGTTLFSQPTDSSGRAHLCGSTLDARTRAAVHPSQEGRRSQFPAAESADRTLDYSRFDVGGVRNARNANEISAYLFSDRGLYARAIHSYRP